MKLIFQTLLLLCLTIQAKAQSKNTGTVVFNVKTIGTNIPDSIIFAFYPENNPYGVLSRYSAQLSEGRSRLVVPKINNPSKFILGAYINGKSRILGEYYAEPNDTLDLSIEMDGLKSEIQFEGKGSGKYTLVKKLVQREKKLKSTIDSIYRVYITPTKKEATLNKETLENYLDAVTYTLGKWSNYRKTLLSSDTTVEPTIKEILASEYGNYDATWVNVVDAFYRTYRDRSELTDLIRKRFNAKKAYTPVLSNQAILLSPAYFINLNFRVKMQMIINNRSSDVGIVPYYEELKKKKTGQAGQRVLTEFFISSFTLQKLTGYTPQVYDSLVFDASKIITSPYYASLLSEKVKTRKGSRLLDSDFIDMDGQIFHPKNLVGKVVLLEMWISGCGACAEFHRIFKEKIKPKIDPKSNFVMLSVNMDKERVKWLEGIKSERFSSAEYLNVSTRDGQENAFFNYYGNSLPLVLLIDQAGNIVTRIRGSENPSDLVSIINAELLKE